MADVKISALPAVVTAAGTDVFPVVQGGATKKETLAQALTWIQTQVAPIPAGGTGLASYTIGDLIYASGATTLAKLADVATGNALLSGGIGVAPSWGKVGLTTHVSGILPLANGGSGADLNATGGANQIVRQNSAGGVFTVSVLAAADIPNLDASKITTGALALARGGTHADLSATGGAGQYLKQSGAGADVTVGTIPATDLTYSGLTTGQLLRATGAASVAFGALDLTNGNAVTNALGAANGGTGKSSYTIGDILFASAATTLTRLAGVATGNALISGGVATDISWGKIGLTTHVSGILPSANGGTGVNNAGTITNASNTTITGGGTLALGGFTATIPATLTVAGLAIANVFTAAQATTITDAATAVTTTLLTLDHESSGTPAANFGTRILFNLQDNTTATQNAAAIDVIWSTATHATHASQMKFFVATAGGGATSESIRLDNLGITAVAGNTAAYFQAAWLAVNSNGGPALVTNFTGSANSSLFLKGATTINTGQAVTIGFGTVITATFDVASAAASSAAVVDNLILRRNPTSGTPAAGTGQQLRMTTQSDTTVNRDQLTMSSEWVVATDASRTARAKFSVFDTAAREAIRLEASGSAAMIGFLGANASARQTGGENLTNSVTAGGVDGTIANYTDLTIYANDAAAIRNDIYQLARALKQDHDALRLYGFLT